MGHTFLFLCMFHNILLETGHCRYNIAATLDTGCLPLGSVIAIHLFIYLVTDWTSSVKSLCPYSLSVKSLLILFRRHSFGFPKLPWGDSSLGRVPYLFPGQTQLLSTTNCQLIAVLFSTSPEAKPAPQMTYPNKSGLLWKDSSQGQCRRSILTPRRSPFSS